MDQAVPHADDLFPGDGGVVRLILDGESVCGFSDDFNQSNESEFQDPVAGKICFFPCRRADLPPLWRDQAYGAFARWGHAASY